MQDAGVQVVVVAVVVVLEEGGDVCEVDCGQNRQKDNKPGEGGARKESGQGKQTKIKQKMGKEYKQRGEN